jgi:hypothetical protein
MPPELIVMTIVILSTAELLFLCTGSYPARPGGVELCPSLQRMAAGSGWHLHDLAIVGS